MINETKLEASFGLLLGLLVMGMLVGGCSSTPSGDSAFAEVPGVSGSGTGPAPAASAPAATAPAAAPGAAPTAAPGSSAYQVLQAGDAIIVVYNDLPTLTPSFEGEIRPDGTITLIENKTFQAAGKTVSELEKEIRKTYVPAYYRQMTVQVRLKDEKRLYSVGGEVRSPGPKMYLGNTTVLKAVQAAGDFTDFAAKTRVTVTRRDGKQIKVNCNKALRDPTLDVEVFPGDTIHVPRRFW